MANKLWQPFPARPALQDCPFLSLRLLAASLEVAVKVTWQPWKWTRTDMPQWQADGNYPSQSSHVGAGMSLSPSLP
jgi:hypothetical protein